MPRSIAYNARLEIVAKFANNQTYPAVTYYESPFKLTNFFRLADGGIEYMLMNASAGVMTGDNYNLKIELQENTKLLISAQSFEKIHSMPNGQATRKTQIKLATNSSLIFTPLPSIPFANSAFITTTEIHLEDNSSRLIYSEIISCGRYLRGERFTFRNYTSVLNIYLAGRLVYRDNCQLLPCQQDLNAIGMFEQSTHLGNLVLYGIKLDESYLDAIQQILNNSGLDCAISQLAGGGYIIRILTIGSESALNLFKILIDQLNQYA
jgi:urease accessory protein